MTNEYPFQTNYSMALFLLPSLLAWMLSMLFLWLAMTLIAFCRQGPSFSQCFLNAYEAQLLTKHNSVSLRERLPNGSPCPPYHNRAGERASERGLGGRSTSFSLSITALIFNRVRIRRRDAAEDTGSSNINIATFAKIHGEASRENKCASQTTSWPSDCRCRRPRPSVPAAAAGDRVFMAQTHRRFDIMDDTRARRGKRERRAAAPN